MHIVSEDLIQHNNKILNNHNTIHILIIQGNWYRNLHLNGVILKGSNLLILKGRNICLENMILHLFSLDPYTIIIIIQTNSHYVTVSMAVDKKCFKIKMAQVPF